MRNAYLSREERARAPIIFQAFEHVRRLVFAPLRERERERGRERERERRGGERDRERFESELLEIR